MTDLNTITIRGIAGRDVIVEGSVSITSSIRTPAAAVIVLGDGTVLDVLVDGRIAVDRAGGTTVSHARRHDGDTVTVIGHLRSVEVKHGGLRQKAAVITHRAEGLVAARCPHCGHDLDDGICPTCCDLADLHSVELSDVHAAFELVALDDGATSFDRALDIVTVGADR